MLAPALSEKNSRDLLDRTLKALVLELDREVFEEAYRGTGQDYKRPYEQFSKDNILPHQVVEFCQNKLWREKL